MTPTSEQIEMKLMEILDRAELSSDIIAVRKYIEKVISKDKSLARKAFADFMFSAGCGCCSNRKKNEAASRRLGKLLDAEKYPNSNDYDFMK